MNNKLICPHCGETLRQSKYIEPLTGQNPYFCDTHDCYPSECCVGTKEIWQALIQAKQDLEIAREALTDIFFICEQDASKDANARISEIYAITKKVLEHKD